MKPFKRPNKNMTSSDLQSKIDLSRTTLDNHDMKIIPIAQWSASKLKTFGQCKFRAQLQYGQKIPEPERPLPKGKTEHANDRGSRIHLAAENYVQGKGEFTDELAKFRPEFDSLKQLFSDGRVSIEGDWAFDKQWAPVPWRSSEAWLRAKLDAIVFLSDYEAVIIDHKTGRKFGNEVGHMQQMQIYQLISFLKYPKLEFITVELWYLDQDDMTQATFTRAQGLKFKHSIERQAHALTDCTDFPASPNIFSCKFCWYSNREGGTGHCERGVW